MISVPIWALQEEFVISVSASPRQKPPWRTEEDGDWVTSPFRTSTALSYLFSIQHKGLEKDCESMSGPKSANIPGKIPTFRRIQSWLWSSKSSFFNRTFIIKFTEGLLYNSTRASMRIRERITWTWQHIDSSATSSWISSSTKNSWRRYYFWKIYYQNCEKR